MKDEGSLPILTAKNMGCPTRGSGIEEAGTWSSIAAAQLVQLYLYFPFLLQSSVITLGIQTTVHFQGIKEVFTSYTINYTE